MNLPPRLIIAAVLPQMHRAAIVVLVFTTACGAPPARTYRIMPVALTPIDGTHNRATAFGRLFCATLQHFRDPDGHSWGDCGRYVEHASPAGSVPATFVSQFRLLLVGGLGDGCLDDHARAFAGAITHLHDTHQVDVETVRLPPFASSQENGRAIARTVNYRWMADPTHRSYILIGYSKGAADVEEALPELSAPRDQVAAVVTIAGLVHGTPEARALDPLFDPSRRWNDHHCPTTSDRDALSLATNVRHDFLRAHPLTVPAYSLVAVSTEAMTSPILRGAWTRLSRYAAEQDGLVAAWDAVLPGARYLGEANADHLTVALSLDEDRKHRRRDADPNRFPREALFEAVVRFVTDDLRTTPAPQ